MREWGGGGEKRVKSRQKVGRGKNETERICLSVYLPVYLLVYLSNNQPIFKSLDLSIYLYLPNHQSIYLPAYLSICVRMHICKYVCTCLSDLFLSFCVCDCACVHLCKYIFICCILFYISMFIHFYQSSYSVTFFILSNDNFHSQSTISRKHFFLHSY